MRLPRRLVRGGAALVFVATSMVTGASAAAGGSSALPFTDPQATGYIGFCDLAGHNVTSGSIDTVPFVWKAVSSARPPSAYSGLYENADLSIYQARQDVDPADWNGQYLSAASYYRRPEYPVAVGTYKDLSLKTIMAEFPPMWNGMYALRMQFGKTGYGIYGSTYPMTVIQVTGNTWHVISGGIVNCDKAAGISQETTNKIVKKVPPASIKNLLPATAPPSSQSTAKAASNQLAPSTKATATTSGGSQLTPTETDPITGTLSGVSSKGGLSGAALAVILVAAVVVVGLAGLLVRRRGKATLR